ncbi:host-nuclease inhibitor Gam family protein [Sphingomonadaceae bacterium G21617-S1]|nr:host-nuclease inhibitor Gam family protein [Sphingomonadaceae bacterium G21617-S1]
MPEITIPTLAEGEKLLARYAKLAAAADGHEADLAAKIAPLKAAADKKLAPIATELDELKAKLEPWWKAHAADLTKGKKKSHELLGCVIGTRANPKKLTFAGGDDEAAIAALRAGRFNALLSRVVSLDKKAITARVDAEPDGPVAKLGFSVVQGETFYVDLATRSRKA